ncbi:hypothetical protein CWB96_10900 [Pseudoalteromonas citrea]|uniref:Prepilin-type cleavage/methylation domain-containing protein n=1 Tax=Pseudoalteromonas citrea TaxID=43655 RepID=A0A5S3XP84_9GAMM|nr:prepilin-type N-terminal cleavage/methylation domain-containing protein [Pseudoalteromonas citrea]TMP45684.1 hypothetical protein CWB97_03545 [Pseudoalteromonas citrea]TMP59063.1 hypothetical protein CWB96_10900 [Pseudoalteromonas citrea]
MTSLHSKQSGFTLIELLIVTLLLSLIMAVGTYSYSLFVDNWQKELGNFNRTKNFTVSVQRVDRLLENVYPYVLIKNNAEAGLLFVGSKSGLLSVTYNGLFNDGSPEVFRISKIENENGRFDLIYQAMSLKYVNIIHEDQPIEFTHKVEIVKDVSDVDFNYYGWSSFRLKSQSTNNEQPKWSSKYSALNTQLLPEKMTMTIKRDNKSVILRYAYDLESERWLSSYSDSET